MSFDPSIWIESANSKIGFAAKSIGEMPNTVFLNTSTGTYQARKVGGWNPIPFCQWVTVDLSELVPPCTLAVELITFLCITNGETVDLTFQVSMQKHGGAGNWANWYDETTVAPAAKGTRSLDTVTVALSSDLKFDFAWLPNIDPQYFGANTGMLVNQRIHKYYR